VDQNEAQHNYVPSSPRNSDYSGEWKISVLFVSVAENSITRNGCEGRILIKSALWLGALEFSNLNTTFPNSHPIGPFPT
jgi:hypothetical protein